MDRAPRWDRVLAELMVGVDHVISPTRTAKYLVIFLNSEEDVYAAFAADLLPRLEGTPAERFAERARTVFPVLWRAELAARGLTSPERDYVHAFFGSPELTQHAFNAVCALVADEAENGIRFDLHRRLEVNVNAMSDDVVRRIYTHLLAADLPTDEETPAADGEMLSSSDSDSDDEPQPTPVQGVSMPFELKRALANTLCQLNVAKQVRVVQMIAAIVPLASSEDEIEVDLEGFPLPLLWQLFDYVFKPHEQLRMAAPAH